MLAWGLIKCQVNHFIDFVSLTDKGAAWPSANNIGIKLSTQVHQLTVAIDVITNHLANG